MREWSEAGQHGLLLHLANCFHQLDTNKTEELWRVHKRDRELVCMAVYLASGIDIWLLEGTDFRRTQLCRDAPAATALANQWKAKLLEVGWEE
jgi:hypothetical protein